MRNSFFGALMGLVLVTAVAFESIAQKHDNEAYVKQNLALVDARVRSIDKEFFVKELVKQGKILATPEKIRRWEIKRPALASLQNELTGIIILPSSSRNPGFRYPVPPG